LVCRSEPQVAGKRHFHSPAERVSVDGGDDRQRKRLKVVEQFAYAAERRCQLLLRRQCAIGLQVSAAAEELVTFARDDDGTKILVASRGTQFVAKRLRGRGVDGVTRLRTADR
jgi:hypothetical protein